MRAFLFLFAIVTAAPLPAHAEVPDVLTTTAFCNGGLTYCRDGSPYWLAGVRLIVDFRPVIAYDVRRYFDTLSLMGNLAKVPITGIGIAMYRNIFALDLAYIAPFSSKAATDSNVLLRVPDANIEVQAGLSVGVSFLAESIQIGCAVLFLNSASFQDARGTYSTVVIFANLQLVTFFRNLASRSGT